MQIILPIYFQRTGYLIKLSLVLLLVACTPQTPLPTQVDNATVVLPSQTVTVAERIVQMATPTLAEVMPSQTPVPLELYETAQLLLSKIESHFSPPGWVSVRSELIRYSGAGPKSFLINGQPEPDQYTEEAWYQFKSGDSVDRSIQIKTTPDGQILETIVYANGKAWYSLLDETREQQPITLDHLGSSSLRTAIEFADKNDHSVVLFEEQDQRIIRISTLEKALRPITMDGFDQKITAMYSEKDYDFLEGWLIRVENHVILEDGTKRLTMTKLIDVQPGLTPPNEILTQLEDKYSLK